MEVYFLGIGVSFWSAVVHDFYASDKAKAARGFLGPPRR